LTDTLRFDCTRLDCTRVAALTRTAAEEAVRANMMLCCESDLWCCKATRVCKKQLPVVVSCFHFYPMVQIFILKEDKITYPRGLVSMSGLVSTNICRARMKINKSRFSRTLNDRKSANDLGGCDVASWRYPASSQNHGLVQHIMCLNRSRS
jgi:hypothetical protein